MKSTVNPSWMTKYSLILKTMTPMVHFTNSPVQSPVLVQPGLSHLRQVSAKRKQEVNLQSKSCDSDVCGQSEASL